MSTLPAGGIGRRGFSDRQESFLVQIVCQNCKSRFRVEPAELPASGREVKCSNCGHAWHQSPLEEAGAETNHGPWGGLLGDSRQPSARPGGEDSRAEALAILREEREHAEQVRSNRRTSSRAPASNEDPVTPVARNRRRRIGVGPFLLLIALLFALLGFVYAYSEGLGRAMPPLAPFLSGYADQVEEIRARILE